MCSFLKTHGTRFTAAFAIASGCVTPQPAFAKERATAVARASAIIVTRLSFIKTQDLDFGKVVPASTAGTVTVAPDGSRQATGGVLAAGRTAQPAKFSGFGSPNQTVVISLSAQTGTLKRQGGTETMQLDTFIIGSSPQVQLSTAPLSFRIASATGQFAFPVGATLRVGARQTPGIYTGTFTVVLQYQ